MWEVVCRLCASLQRKNAVQSVDFMVFLCRETKSFTAWRRKLCFHQQGERALLLLMWEELFVAGISSSGSTEIMEVIRKVAHWEIIYFSVLWGLLVELLPWTDLFLGDGPQNRVNLGFDSLISSPNICCLVWMQGTQLVQGFALPLQSGPWTRSTFYFSCFFHITLCLIFLTWRLSVILARVISEFRSEPVQSCRSKSWQSFVF